MLVWKLHGPVMRTAQCMTSPCKNIFITALADYSGYLWRKIPPQKV